MSLFLANGFLCPEIEMASLSGKISYWIETNFNIKYDLCLKVKTVLSKRPLFEFSNPKTLIAEKLLDLC
jgi:hypothetical protein